MRKRGLATVVLAVSIACTPSPAQEVGSEATLPSLDSILNLPVSAASLYEQSRTEAPARVTIVTREDIEQFGFRTLGEVLESASGFYVSSDRQYGYLGVRGFGRPADLNHRVLFLLDGHTMNEAVLGAVPVGGAFGVDMESVERVEIVRGPGSPLYGSRAMLAVVNVITRDGAEVDGVNATAALGNLGSQRVSVLAGGGLAGGLRYLFSGSWMEADGEDVYSPEFDRDATNNGVAANLDWERANRAAVRLSFEGWQLRGNVSQREKGIPTAPYGMAFNHPSARTRDVRQLLELTHHRALGPSLEVEGRAYWDRYENEGDYPFTAGMLDTRFASRSAGFETHLQWDPIPRTRLVFGAELFRASTAEFSTRLAGGGWLFDGGSPYSVLSIFGQDELQVTESVGLTLGFRHDRYAQSSVTNPRGALIVHLDESSTAKLLYGSAFRGPNVYELELEATTGYLANPDLRAERVRTTEFAVERRFGPRLVVEASLYRSRMTDLIDQVQVAGLAALQFQNRSIVSAEGFELDVTGGLQSGARGYARYSYQRTQEEGGGDITNYPAHSARFGAALPLGPVNAGASVRIESGRGTVRGDRTDAYWLADLNLATARLVPGLKATLNVKNLLDKRYAMPGGFHHVQDAITQLGRVLSLELSLIP